VVRQNRLEGAIIVRTCTGANRAFIRRQLKPRRDEIFPACEPLTVLRLVRLSFCRRKTLCDRDDGGHGSRYMSDSNFASPWAAWFYLLAI
jgi:hypothetical protein